MSTARGITPSLCEHLLRLEGLGYELRGIASTLLIVEESDRLGPDILEVVAWLHARLSEACDTFDSHLKALRGLGPEARDGTAKRPDAPGGFCGTKDWHGE